MTLIESLCALPGAHDRVPRTSHGRGEVSTVGWEIRSGTIHDYARLARHHYRAGPPATIVRVWTAHAASRDRAVGVLVLSMPVLNGPWRAVAWPREFGPSIGPRERASRLNHPRSGVRCISRLIVDPAFRAQGVGAALVRWALAHAPTSRTEAVAAMGLACPVFERAGMRRIEVPAAARDERLLAALRSAGIREWQLVDVREAHRGIRREAALIAAFRRWANDARGTRDLSHGPLPPLIEGAAISLANGGRKVVYVNGT